MINVLWIHAPILFSAMIAIPNTHSIFEPVSSASFISPLLFIELQIDVAAASARDSDFDYSNVSHFMSSMIILPWE